MTERSHGRSRASTVSLVAVGGALLVVGYLWGRNSARSAAYAAEPSASAEQTDPVEDAGPSRIMETELERLAGLAMSHGRDDQALDVFLAFVGALDPLPDAATLQPAAERIGELALVQALDRPGDARLGARRLLAAASLEVPRPDPPRDRPGNRVSGTVTVDRKFATARGLPDLFDALVHAIRGALSLFA